MAGHGLGAAPVAEGAHATLVDLAHDVGTLLTQRDKVARMLERAGADSSSGQDVPSDTGNSLPVVGATYATVLNGSAGQAQPASAESSSATLGSALASPVPPAGLTATVQ